ncbi:MAG: hypothetical protein ACPGN3_15510 [Opitutales bacterium]
MEQSNRSSEFGNYLSRPGKWKVAERSFLFREGLFQCEILVRGAHFDEFQKVIETNSFGKKALYEYVDTDSAYKYEQCTWISVLVRGSVEKLIESIEAAKSKNATMLVG